jgi:antitoxin component YwqK of YwqJK toxin-antitoxin module
MSKKGKIISLNDFKEKRKLTDPDGNPFTGVCVDYYDYEDEQKEYETRYKDGKENGLCTWWYENGQKGYEIRYKDGELNGLYTYWYENGQIECEGFFKDGTEVDDPRTELDENELSPPSNAPAVFIKEFCLVIFYGFLGVKLSSYIFDVWL